MRGLVVFLSERMTKLPEIPALKESGYDVVVESRISIYGPSRMPKDIVKSVIQDSIKADC